MRWRRLGIGCLGVLGLGVVGVVTLAISGTLYLQTQAGNLLLKTQIENAVTGAMAKGRFEIDHLETDLWGRLHIRGLRIVDAQGTPLVELQEARARYDLFSLLTGPLQVERLDGIGLILVLDQGNERMALAELFGPPSGSTEPFQLPIDFDVSTLSVEGVDVQVDDSFVLSGGVLHGALLTSGPTFIGSGIEACAHLVVPGPTALCVEGPLTWDGSQAVLSGLLVEGPATSIALEGVIGTDQVNVVASVGRVDLEAIDPIANYVGIAGQFAGSLRVAGPPADLTVTGELAGLEGTQGTLSLTEGYWRTGEKTSWGGLLRPRGLDVEQVYTSTGRPVVLDGELSLDAVGLKFPEDLEIDLTYTGDGRIEDRYRVEDGRFSGKIANGVLDLQQGEFHGIAGPLDARGAIDLVDGPLDLHIQGSLDGEELDRIGVSGLSGDNRVDITLRGDLKHDPGRFRLDGIASFAPLVYRDIRMERLVAEVSGTVDGADYDLMVDLDGDGGLAYGMNIHDLGAVDLGVRSQGGNLEINGPLEAGSIEVPGAIQANDVTVTVQALLPSVGKRRVTADVLFGAHTLETFPGSAGDARFQLNGDALQYDAHMRAWGRDLLVSRGTYDLSNGMLDASRLDVAPTPRLAWRADGPVHLQVVEGGVHEATLVMRGLHGDIEVHGDLASIGDLEGHVVTRNLQLDALAELYPERFSGLSGVLDVDATIEGPATSLAVEGTTRVVGLWVEGSTRWMDIDGRFKGRDDMLELHLNVGTAGEPLATIDGELPVKLATKDAGLLSTAPVDLDLALLPGPLERLEQITVAALDVPPGEISGVVELTGPLEDPRIELKGVVESPLGGWEQPGRVEIDLVRQDTALSGWASVREGLEERAGIQLAGQTRLGEVTRALVNSRPLPDTGDIELWANDIVSTVFLTKLPVESVLDATEQNIPAKGSFSGTVTAKGSPLTPEVGANIRWTRGSIGDYALETSTVRVESTPTGIDVDGDLAFVTGGRGRVAGSVPVRVDLREKPDTWHDGPLDLSIEATALPMGVLSLADPGLSEATGTLDLNGTIAGTLQRPDADLRGQIHDGAFTYTPLGLKVSRLGGQLIGERRRIRVLDLTANTEPLYPIGLLDDSRQSRIKLNGSANLDGMSLSQLTARAELDDAWVTGLADQALRTHGEVMVSGNWPRLRVRGDVELVNGRIKYDPTSFAGAGSLQTDRRLMIHRKGIEVQAAEPKDDEGALALDLDLDVDLNRNLELLATYPFLDDLGSLTANLTKATLTTRLGGDLNIALNEESDFQLGGEVDVVEGTAQLLRTKFTVDNGTVYFVGGEVGSTQLEINGTSDVQGVPIDLVVRGTVDHPEITTSAQGYDQSQVLVMLLTNRAPDQLATTQGQQAAQQLGATAALLLASSVFSGSAAGAISIEADGSVKVGAPWSSSVFAQLVFNAFADQTNENRISFSLDWTVAPRMVVELGAGDRFQWTDLTWETRF